MRRYNRHVPVFQALAAALTFALSAPLAKLLLGDVPPLLLAGLLYLGAGLFLSLLGIVRPGRVMASRGFAPRERWVLAGAVAAGGIAAPPLLLWGLARSPASATALLLNLEVVLTALMAGIIWREHLGRRVIGATILMTAGGAWLAWPGGRLEITAASLAIVAACALWALDNNLTRMIADLDALRIARLKGLVAGATNLILALALGQPRPGLAVTASSLALGAVSYGTSLVLFILAMRSLGAARTSGYFALAPFLGALLSVILLPEPVSAPLAGSGLLLASGVWLLFRERHSHVHTHEAGVHTHRHVHDEHHRHAHEGWEGPEPHTHAHATGPLEHGHPHVHDEHHRHPHV
jgi:drug/metabolite transporter (DMT)-like permease